MVITGGWCVAKKKRNIHTEDTTSHGENKRKKKGEKKRKKKRKKKKGKKKMGKKKGKIKEVPSIELANFG